MIYIKKYYKQHLLTTLLAHSLNLNIKENGRREHGLLNIFILGETCEITVSYRYTQSTEHACLIDDMIM